MPELERAKSYPAFRCYLRARLGSQEGCFYRVRFKGARADGDGLQLAPESSLAPGWSVKPGPDGWRFWFPKLKQLLKDFFDGRKPGFVPKASALFQASRR